MRRRRFLAVLVARGAVVVAGLALRRRVPASAPPAREEDALARLCEAIAPGAPGLPGARALGVAGALPAALRRRATALLIDVAATTPLDEAALARLATRHPAAMDAVRAHVYGVLYGTSRHGGKGAAGAFATLRYP